MHNVLIGVILFMSYSYNTYCVFCSHCMQLNTFQKTIVFFLPRFEEKFPLNIYQGLQYSVTHKLHDRLQPFDVHITIHIVLCFMFTLHVSENFQKTIFFSHRYEENFTLNIYQGSQSQLAWSAATFWCAGKLNKNMHQIWRLWSPADPQLKWTIKPCIWSLIAQFREPKNCNYETCANEQVIKSFQCGTLRWYTPRIYIYIPV